MTLRLKPKPPKMGARVQERMDFPRHRQFIRRHACIMPECYGLPIQAAHVRRGTDGGIGLRPHDMWCVPLCSGCHAAQHRMGEEAFWGNRDPKATALSFALKSPVPEVQEKARQLLTQPQEPK